MIVICRLLLSFQLIHLVNSRQAVFIVGSAIGQNARTAELYTPEHGGQLLPFEIPFDMYQCGGAYQMSDGRILVIDGDGHGRTFTVDVCNNKTAIAQPTLIKRDSPASVLYQQDTILLCGGYENTTFLNSCEVFYNGQWQMTEQRMNQSRYHHTLSMHSDSSLVAVGGWSGADSLASVETFDGQWNSEVPLRLPRDGHAAMLHMLYYNAEELFICGGFVTGGTAKDCIARQYDGTYTDAPNLVLGRNLHAMTSMGGVLYTFGGIGTDRTSLDSMEVYDNVEKKWVLHRGVLAKQRYGHCVAVVELNC